MRYNQILLLGNNYIDLFIFINLDCWTSQCSHAAKACGAGRTKLSITQCLWIFKLYLPQDFFFSSRYHSRNKSWPAKYLCLFRSGNPPVSENIAGSSSSLSHGSWQADLVSHSMACSITAVCIQVSSQSACHQTHASIHLARQGLSTG